MQDAPVHDVDQLVIGGTVRRRRRSLLKIGVGAAAVAVLVGVGAYGVTQLDSEVAAEPAGPAPTTTTPQTYDSEEQIAPGTYRMLVGIDDAGVAIHADLSFDSRSWNGGSFPVLSGGSAFGGVGIYRPDALAAGTGCVSEDPNPQVAEDAQALAEQLSQLPRSTVVQSPAPVQAFGRDAVHLQVRIDNDCGAEGYRLADTVRGSHGISYGQTSTGAVVDFWVVDINGIGVVVVAWHDEDASTTLVDEIGWTRDSIAFVA